jgi:hypothetical protein
MRKSPVDGFLLATSSIQEVVKRDHFEMNGVKVRFSNKRSVFCLQPNGGSDSARIIPDCPRGRPSRRNSKHHDHRQESG